METAQQICQNLDPHMVSLIIDFMIKNNQFPEKELLTSQSQVLKKTKLFEKQKEVEKKLNQEYKNENLEKETKEKLLNFEKTLSEVTEDKVFLMEF